MSTSSAKKKMVKFRKAIHWDDIPKGARQVIAAIMGTVIALAGVAMLFLPGPAFVVIPLGLAILASEFIWARKWLAKTFIFLKKAKRRTKKAVGAA
jgi:hypothetical protein